MKNQPSPIGSTAHLDALSAAEKRIESERLAALATINAQRKAALEIRHPLNVLRQQRDELVGKIAQLEKNLAICTAKADECAEVEMLAAGHDLFCGRFEPIWDWYQAHPEYAYAARMKIRVAEVLAERRVALLALENEITKYATAHGLENAA